MDRASRALLLEARMILHMLYSVAQGSSDWEEDLPRHEVIHLLYVAKARLDAIDSDDQNLQ